MASADVLDGRRRRKRQDNARRNDTIAMKEFPSDRSKCSINFLTTFLDDSTVRDSTGKQPLYDGPHAGKQFPKLEVRNFAAWRLAGILKIEASPKPDWSPEQWAKLRDRVRKALPR